MRPARSRSAAARTARSRSRAITSRWSTSPGSSPRRRARTTSASTASSSGRSTRAGPRAASARSATTTACGSAFGSCRVAHPDEPPWTLTKDEDPRGREHDALRTLAMKMRAQDVEDWPHLLLLLGDQVYADEVPVSTAEFIAARRDPSVPPGYEVADFEEYCRLYRDSWSEPAVRWLLSTVPTAMIFDDHDVHDDWNTSKDWVRRHPLAGLVGRAHRRRLHGLLGLPAPRQPPARGPHGRRDVPRRPRGRRRRRRRSSASSPSPPTARSRARAGATAATSAARAS